MTRNVVLKFQLRALTGTTIEVPALAHILHVAAQDGGIPTIWFQVDPNRELVKRRFVAIATGQYFEIDGLSFVGSAAWNQLGDMPLVWHIYEVVT